MHVVLDLCWPFLSRLRCFEEVDGFGGKGTAPSISCYSDGTHRPCQETRWVFLMELDTALAFFNGGSKDFLE